MAQRSDPSGSTEQAQPEQTLLKPEQLEALVAPIALYPDELLANVLAASTYPLEVVQADRWVKANKNLKGDALKAAVDKQAWDDSVKALASTPDVLAMMSDKIDWTKNLGDAVLAQQPDVMDAIQRLRAKAQARNKLVTNKQQKVSVQKQENKDVIVIEQAQPDTMYVPYYDPATVYGDWPYTEYPPYYFGYPSYIGAGVDRRRAGIRRRLGDRTLGQLLGRRLQLGQPQPLRQSLQQDDNIGNNWQHNPAHRQGVKYNNANVANRFGNNNLKAGAATAWIIAVAMASGAGDRREEIARRSAGDRAGDRAATGPAIVPDAAEIVRAIGSDRAKGGGDRAKGGGDRAKGGGDRAKGGGGIAPRLPIAAIAAAAAPRGRRRW